jgi:non-heme Fe2+,alpha-ketoglutarate-dependent halogenase
VANTLTTEQLNHYNREGYCFPFDAFPPKTAQAYHQKLLDFEQEIGQDPLNVLRIKSHLVVPWLVEMASTPAILDVVEDIIGPDIMLYLSALWAKPANDTHYVSWHQDSTYFGLDPHDEVTVWTALTPSTVESGCIRVLPGSHTQPDMTHVEPEIRRICCHAARLLWRSMTTGLPIWSCSRDNSRSITNVWCMVQSPIGQTCRGSGSPLCLFQPM